MKTASKKKKPSEKKSAAIAFYRHVSGSYADTFGKILGTLDSKLESRKKLETEGFLIGFDYAKTTVQNIADIMCADHKTMEKIRKLTKRHMANCR